MDNMFREILSHPNYTDAVGNPLEIRPDQLFGFRKKLDECLKQGQCEGEKLTCWFEAQKKTSRGVIENVLIKYCDVRIDGNPILIPEQNDF